VELAKQLVELAELFAVTAETLTELITELKKQAKIWQLEAQIEIQQLKELEALLIAVRY
jgi:hypothetical protein